jgi:hypothetical protein
MCCRGSVRRCGGTTTSVTVGGVEAIDSPVQGKRYPVCLDGARACPPEDCGGIPGYGRLLAALADPKDPEHDELAEWAPDGFDPEVFDLVAANRRLRGR